MMVTRNRQMVVAADGGAMFRNETTVVDGAHPVAKFVLDNGHVFEVMVIGTHFTVRLVTGGMVKVEPTAANEVRIS